MQKFLFLLVSINSIICGSSMAQIDPAYADNNFCLDGKRFSGNVNASRTWSGSLCNGAYGYDVNVNGVISDVIVNITEDSLIKVQAVVTDISGNQYGYYKSMKTLCQKAWLNPRYSIDQMNVDADVILHSVEGNQVPKAEVKIKSTRFSRVNFSNFQLAASWSPFLTQIINWGAERVWQSFLGNWINQELSKKINNPGRRYSCTN